MKFIKKLFSRLFLLGILAVCLYIYAFHVEPNLLTVTYEEITLSDNAINQAKIVVFSDTHFREVHTKEDIDSLVEKINEQEPDVVFFLGDLIDDYQNDPVDTQMIIDGFLNISAKYAKYAIMGNHDYGGYAEKIYSDIMKSSGFNILINDTSTSERLGLTFAGLDDALLGNPDYLFLRNIETEYPVLLLSHEADFVQPYSAYYDLAFSGHSHGGQVNIPILRDYVLPEGNQTYIKGYYEKAKIYVTSGIGTTKIHARFMVVPEIVVIDLKY